MTMAIHRIGVIGAGQMGNGIAQVCAVAGLDVVINDVTDDRLKAGLATINGHLAREVTRGQIDEVKRREALSRIEIATGLERLADCDLVIEAASENEEIKRKIFINLRPYLKSDAIVSTNTSSISIT